MGLRLRVRATTAGTEVGSLLVDERDVQGAVSQLAWMALGHYRDDHNRLADPDTITLTIEPDRS